MDAGFFKGTSTDQDKRFSDKEAKLLKSMKFPPEFEKKVDTRKVNLQVMRPWIVKKVVELVGFEDEVVVEYAMGLLEDTSKPIADPKLMQINLTGFLTSSTPAFMQALWNLLLEAQDSPAGIPKSFIEEKKEEMRTNQSRRGFSSNDNKPRLDEIREREQRERGNRGRGGRGGRGGGRNFDDRAPPYGGGNDRNGHGKQRDSGWGARGGRPRPASRSRSPPAYRRRSPSRTPPLRQRSDSPIDRSPPGPDDRAGRGRQRPPSNDRSDGSRSPPPRQDRFRSRSRSRSPRDYRHRVRSRSPQYRRRSVSRSPPRKIPRGNARGASRSRSRSGGPESSPRARRRSRSRSYESRSRSPTSRRHSRRSQRSRSPRHESERDSRHRGKKRQRSESYSRSPSVSRSQQPSRRDEHDEGEGNAQPKTELKIKGSASANKSNVIKHKALAERLAEEEELNKATSSLQQKERELKEAALRNKLVKSKGRKNSMAEDEEP